MKKTTPTHKRIKLKFTEKGIKSKKQPEERDDKYRKKWGLCQDFSSEAVRVRRQWSNILKELGSGVEVGQLMGNSMPPPLKSLSKLKVKDDIYQHTNAEGHCHQQTHMARNIRRVFHSHNLWSSVYQAVTGVQLPHCPSHPGQCADIKGSCCIHHILKEEPLSWGCEAF